MNVREARDKLGSFQKVNLCASVTPLTRLYNLEKNIDSYMQIYMKRDDLNGLGSGGNKIRNLEYLLGDAIKNECDVVIASGKAQSNLCSLTAAACNKVNLDCIIVHNDDNDVEFSGNVLLNNLLGTKIHYIGNVSEEERSKYVENLAQELINQDIKPYIIYNGGSTALGALGYVEAMIEIYEQCINSDIKIDNIFLPGGNGGLAAGAIYGATLIDAPFKIQVITVEHENEKLEEILIKLIKEIEELLNHKLDKDYHSIINIYDEYRGDGWGKETEEGVRQVYDLAQTEGIFLEKVYTSKTLYGMIDLMKSKKTIGSSCYLHSGGFGALFSQFKSKDNHEKEE